MRIDAHQHYWDPDLIHYFWMPSEPGVLRQNYLPEDLQPILQRNNFNGSIVVQAAQVPEEAPWLLDLADRHSSILGVIAWADLTDPAQLGHMLDRLQRNPKFKGLRHLIQDEADARWGLQPNVIASLKACARTGEVRNVYIHIHMCVYVYICICVCVCRISV